MTKEIAKLAVEVHLDDTMEKRKPKKQEVRRTRISDEQWDAMVSSIKKDKYPADTYSPINKLTPSEQPRT